MPRTKKQKIEEPVVSDGEEEDDEDQDDEDEDDSGTSTEMIQAEFEAFAPVEKDFGGIKALLQQLLLKAPINLSELAESIIQQSDLGCVHKVATDEDAQGDQEDAMETDEDVYGLVTLVDITKDDKEFVRQLRELLRKRCTESKSPKSDEAKSAFEDLWTTDGKKSKRIGWVINERLINLPFQIAAPSFESLLSDLDASGIKFDRFLAILKIHKLNEGDSNEEGASSSSTGKGKSKKKQPKKPKGGRGAQSPDMVVFANPEEELLDEECSISFDYGVSSETDGGLMGDRRTDDGFYKPYRRVIMFDRAAFDKFLTKLKAVGSSS